MTIWDFRVTQPYGYDPSYPLNNGFHRGIDYGAPDNTPVTVNGVVIGLSGHSGFVTGAHTHVGKFVNGQAVDPGTKGGMTLSNAVVLDTGNDTTNGNFVRVQSGNATYVYLHLSKITCSKGQKLEEVIVDKKVFIQGAPAAVSWGKERIDVFACGSDNGIWHKWFDKQWNPWERIGDGTPDLTVSSWEEGRLDIFFRGVAGDLVHLWYDGTGFKGPESLGVMKEA